MPGQYRRRWSKRLTRAGRRGNASGSPRATLIKYASGHLPALRARCQRSRASCASLNWRAKRAEIFAWVFTARRPGGVHPFGASFFCHAETKGWAVHSVRGLGPVRRPGRARSARPTFGRHRSGEGVATRPPGTFLRRTRVALGVSARKCAIPPLMRRATTELFPMGYGRLHRHDLPTPPHSNHASGTRTNPVPVSPCSTPAPLLMRSVIQTSLPRYITLG